MRLRVVRSTVNGILPYVFSYISQFVCLYNFNYTGRPLRGPGIIGIKLDEMSILIYGNLGKIFTTPNDLFTFDREIFL